MEDDSKMATLLQRGLGTEGLATDATDRGEDAVWMAAATAYDAIVLDVMLPGIDGFDTCRRLREDGVWTPVLMLTARDGEIAEQRAVGSGGNCASATSVSAGGPAYERFIADQMVPTDQSPADRAKAGVAMRERVGALKFKSLLAILSTQVIMVVESERAGDLKVSLQVEPAPPNRVLPRIDVNPYP